ncbi:MAG: ATP-binding cassette domain-containing protein [Eubacterium sp.]|nr:ATP-binding cassette domain-containing protein [Eubacterium sp.]
MKEMILQTTGLTKKYGSQSAVNRISMQVERGAIYGLIGKNGAGKTTFMKLITGLANATEGEITLFGKTGVAAASQQKRIGLLIENPGIYGNLSAFENLKLKAIGMGVYRKEKIDEILRLVGLADVGRKKAKQFSLGMKQRLGIGLALIGSPDFLILDEPINGLDPQGILEVRRLIERLNKEYKITVLISSHILEELYKIVTHVGIIDRGELLIQLTKEELEDKCAKKLVITTEQTDKAAVVLEKMNVRQYSVIDAKTIYAYECLERIREINAELVKADVPVLEIRSQNESLEEFFLELIERGTK